MDFPETKDDSQQILEGVGNEVLFSVAALVAGVVFLIYRLSNTATFLRDDGVHRRGDRDLSADSASGTAAGRESESQRPISDARAENGNDFSSTGSDHDDRSADQQEDTSANGGQLIDIEVKALYSDSGRETLLSRRVSGATSILDLKSLLFSDELEERRRVRIVFQGRELVDHVVLGECNFSRGAVLNAVIGAVQSREQEQRDMGNRGDAAEFDIAVLFPYLLAALCTAGWCFLLLRPDIALTATFTVAIILLTVVTYFAWRS